MKDTNEQLKDYCKHDIAEFKEKFLNILRSTIEEKKDLEEKFASQALEVSRKKETTEREDDLLKAAMYHVRQLQTTTVY